VQRAIFPLWIVIVLCLVACSGAGPGMSATGTTTRSRGSAGPATPSPRSEPSPSVEPSPSPAVIPSGVPTSYDEDVAARELPVDELIPPSDEVTAVDRARTDAGEVVVIAFATPAPDPFRQARGFVVWRRDDGGASPWRAVYGIAHGKRDGVLAISADTTDLTGDGSDDALIREETGGSGMCATYRVIDLAVGPIWTRAVCDAEIQPNPEPIGLYEVARIYAPEDPHCCPSAIRERVLAWNGDRFVVVSEESTTL
jgi:hypothetical protein